MGCGASQPSSQQQQTTPVSSTPATQKVPGSASLKGQQQQEDVHKSEMWENRTKGEAEADWTFVKKLGDSTLGAVWQVKSKVDAKDLAACKIISKHKAHVRNKLSDNSRDVKAECAILEALKSEHVIGLRQVYEAQDKYYMVIELAQGGDLYDELYKRHYNQDYYTEKDTADLMKKVITIVDYIHSKNVVHRDIRPENFLLSSPGAVSTNLKLGDFALSTFYKQDQTFRAVRGSLNYVAPEVLKHEYKKEADVWSTGVMLFLMLSGRAPFSRDTSKATFAAIKSEEPDFTCDPWPSVSEEAKDLCKKILNKEPMKRLTTQQILEHPWMKNPPATKPLPGTVLTRLAQLKAANRFTREARKVLARLLPEEEVKGMLEAFRELDTAGDGTVTITAVIKALRQRQPNVDAAELAEVMSRAGLGPQEKIDYEEFLAATMHLSAVNRDDALNEVFKHFDKDNSGYITRDEIQEGLTQAQIEVPDVDKIINEVDKDKDGKISYQEFQEMLRSDVAGCNIMAVKVNPGMLKVYSTTSLNNPVTPGAGSEPAAAEQQAGGDAPDGLAAV